MRGWRLPLCITVVITLWAASSGGWESYHDPALNDQGYCTTCHPGFALGRTDTLHALHTGGTDPITQNCNLCHTGSGRDNPLTMWSAGDTTSPGLGCAGCHGRDYGLSVEGSYRGFATAGLPKNSGFGLRLHHAAAGITVCQDCHADDLPPVGEVVLLPLGDASITHYYERPDVRIGGMSVDMCANEDTANDLDDLGLDNDGDDTYDFAGDLDCQAPPPEDCANGFDDDADLLVDCDDPDCTGDPACAPPGCTGDAECQDGEFCNGAEVCNLATGQCEPGVPVDPNDGVACTDDSCDEVNDQIVNAPNDALCDDGLFCDGAEVCDPLLDCQPGPDPCAPGDVCDEVADVCVVPPECTVDADCDDGAFCNGAETCDPASGQCQPGVPPTVDDGVGCTMDSCDEVNDVVVNAPNDALCDDGQFCNGAETCDAVQDCQSGTPPCAPGETCDEQGDQCVVEVLDLDIAAFRAPHKLRLSAKNIRGLVLVVRNEGLVEGSAEAQVISTNAAGEQVIQSALVTDPVGNGRTRYDFPFPVSLGEGEITHRAILLDDDPDLDEADAATSVGP